MIINIPKLQFIQHTRLRRQEGPLGNIFTHLCSNKCQVRITQKGGDLFHTYLGRKKNAIRPFSTQHPNVKVFSHQQTYFLKKKYLAFVSLPINEKKDINAKVLVLTKQLFEYGDLQLPLISISHSYFCVSHFPLVPF